MNSSKSDLVVNVNDKILNISQITIKNIRALQLSKFELNQIISNFKKVSLELSLEGSESRYVEEIWNQSIPNGWACVRESSLAELGAQARQNVICSSSRP
jgi:hypothetical protein